MSLFCWKLLKHDQTKLEDETSHEKVLQIGLSKTSDM